MSFYNATKSLAKMIDSQGDWFPVPSLIDHDNFRPFCLLQKKRKTSWWQSCPFHKTEYQFYHLLLSGNNTSRLVLNNSELFTFEVTVDGTLKGDISGITDTEITSAVSISYERSVKMKKIDVPIQDLESLMKKEKINNEHPFIKQSKKLQRNLYVITASAEAVEMTKFGETNKVESSIFHKAYIKLNLKGSRDRKKIITIPKGCILAFKVKKLFIEEETVGISYYSNDKTGTFGTRLVCKCAVADITKPEAIKGKVGGRLIRPAVLYAGKYDNRKNLRREVEKEYEPFSLMSSNLRGKFLASFVVLMNKSDLLGELELQLEQVLEDPEQFKVNMDKPEFKDLMDNLQDVKGAIVIELAEATLYFLQALDELTEFQIMLLVKSMEKKIVSQQLNLVGRIIEEYFWNEKQNFTVEVQQLPEEEWDITEALIEEISGISIQQRGCTVTKSVNSDASSALSALYVALFAIDLLSKTGF
ncbi:gasdermin-A [Pantherophis guttatus]|uniref:Gasdermin-A n=1 Tax=Pantherophis guttatus TaxID=94885 RepID=A0ABM3ZGZ3_PANGU|nr:gasdermin-A [Pantherophis guttatus]XP_060547641.1 gasdermin-A [Pantherophis guttatus]